jgi:hypothetical protein
MRLYINQAEGETEAYFEREPGESETAFRLRVEIVLGNSA